MTAHHTTIWNRFIIKATPLVFLGVILGLPASRALPAPDPIVEPYLNGNIHLRIEVDDQGQPHGWTREYFESGILKAERHYTHGVREGISRLYYNSGELMTEWVYRNGQRHGPSLGYFKNGRLKDRGVYQNDRLEGPVIKYYPSGAVKARMQFENDRLDGESYVYYETGQVQNIYRYFKGRVWTRKDFSPDGKLLRKQEFPQPAPLP